MRHPCGRKIENNMLVDVVIRKKRKKKSDIIKFVIYRKILNKKKLFTK